MSRIRIPVTPPPAADYEVIVEAGCLERIGALVERAAPAHRYAVIADRSVAERWGGPVLASLEAAGLRADLFEFPAGEQHKTRATWAALTDAMLAAGLGRDAAVIGLGGGVTTDLAGFVAATYMRGIPLVQIPTSLLAMVDASVGGKTGVDTADGKNLVGAFHQPRLVAIDTRVLETLPEQELRSGLAESVKHGAIADPDYLRRIDECAARILDRDAETLAWLVQRSVEIKAAFVARDPFENGARQALNFGHTIGHAIEALSDYQLPHGYAVAIGMVAEAAAGETDGVTAPGTADTLRELLGRLTLPTRLPAGVDADDVVALMHRDKKARAGQIRTTLLTRLGSVARTAHGEWSFALDTPRIIAALQV